MIKEKEKEGKYNSERFSFEDWLYKCIMCWMSIV